MSTDDGLTEVEEHMLADAMREWADYPDATQSPYDAVERILAAREAAAEQRGRDAVLADVEALAQAWLSSTTWDGRVEPVGRAYGRALADLIAKTDTPPAQDPSKETDQ